MSVIAAKTINLGVPSTGVITMDHGRANWFTTIQGAVTGTVSVTAQYTLDNVFAPAYVEATGNWFPLATVTAAVASFCVALPFPVSAVRVIFNSGAGSLDTRVLQQGA